MGNPSAFLNIPRKNPVRRPAELRLRDWREVYEPQSEDEVREQASRCMDCGIPFCHQGCPLGNLIPEWNDLVYRGEFATALDRLHATNNFPEFTGRLCPAPCESACVAGIGVDAVAIERTEYEIIERGFAAGLVQPVPANNLSGKTVAIVGSGPAGLAAAQQLQRAGHAVTVFERQSEIGGLLRFGIPEFKMEKHVIDRRLDQMRMEGVSFVTNASIGSDGHPSLRDLRLSFDAVVLAVGSTRPRDVPVEGRDLVGIYPAMDYLAPSNIAVTTQTQPLIDAKDKAVVILGGGDTGADCLGTALRQGARSVTQLELLDRPPVTRPETSPWPTMPVLYKVTSAHEEGGERVYAARTRAFVGSERVEALEVEQLSYGKDGIPVALGTETIPADLVLIAAGFVGPEAEHFSELKVTDRGTILVNHEWLSEPTNGGLSPVFAGGDAVRGQSLIVWAIAEGRSVAANVHRYLEPDGSPLPEPLRPLTSSWSVKL